MKIWIAAIIAGGVALSVCAGSETATETTVATATAVATTAAPAATDAPTTTGAPSTTAAPTTAAPTTAAPTTAAPTTAAPTTVASTVLLDDRPAALILRDSVEATLAANSFSAEVLFDVAFDNRRLRLTADASVDYGAVVAEAVFGGGADGAVSEIEVLADGTSLWVRADGPDFPPFPPGARWVQGDASRLTSAGTLDPTGLVGAVIALRGAVDVDVVGTELSADGVEVIRYATSIAYEDAVAAADDRRAEFERAISLGGLPAVLDIEVTIGSDDVVRSFDAAIGIPDDIARDQVLELDGVYRFTVTGVGERVVAPAAPNPALVAIGPDAEAILDQLIG